jgi:hypothetical protein
MGQTEADDGINSAGLSGMIWPTTIQSNRWRKAARRSFAVGAERAFCNCSILGGDVDALNGRELRHAAPQASRRIRRLRARIGAARVRIPDLRREEFEEAIGGARAVGGNEGRCVIGEGDELIHFLHHALARRTSSFKSTLTPKRWVWV